MGPPLLVTWSHRTTLRKLYKYFKLFPQSDRVSTSFSSFSSGEEICGGEICNMENSAKRQGFLSYLGRGPRDVMSLSPKRPGYRVAWPSQRQKA
jgi:hypothetical protein